MASLENRGNGSWRIIISNGYDARGKKQRITKTVQVDPKKTELSQRREVEKEAAKLQADFDRHLVTDSRKIRFSEVADEFLKAKEQAPSTKQWYRNLLDGRINPAIGKIYVQDLTPRTLRKFFSDLNNDAALSARSKTGKLSGTYRQHYYRVISAVLTFAVKSEYISVNPLQAVDAPRNDTPEAQFFEENELGDLINVLENLPDRIWKAYFLLELFTSCRPGELIGLNWEDIKGNILKVAHGAYRLKGIGTIRSPQPKTETSVRSIPLPDIVMEALNAWKAEQAAYKLQFGSGWPEESATAIFTGFEGKRMDLSSPTQKWRKIQKSNNLKDVPLYSYRHTGASILIDSGCSVKEVSGRLGHSRASTTLDIYSHLFRNAAQHSTDVMSAAIDNARIKAM